MKGLVMDCNAKVLVAEEKNDFCFNFFGELGIFITKLPISTKKAHNRGSKQQVKKTRRTYMKWVHIRPTIHPKPTNHSKLLVIPLFAFPPSENGVLPSIQNHFF